MGLIFHVDAFADRPFTGNPAAVCLLSEPGEERWMQKVAQEMNSSETAFLYRQEDCFNLRWFTLAAEVELCGHATHTLLNLGKTQTHSFAIINFSRKQSQRLRSCLL